MPVCLSQYLPNHADLRRVLLESHLECFCTALIAAGIDSVAALRDSTLDEVAAILQTAAWPLLPNDHNQMLALLAMLRLRHVLLRAGLGSFSDPIIASGVDSAIPETSSGA